MFNYVGKEGDIHGDLALGDLDPKSKRDEIFGGALAKESFDDFIATLKEEVRHSIPRIQLIHHAFVTIGSFTAIRKRSLMMHNRKCGKDHKPITLNVWSAVDD